MQLFIGRWIHGHTRECVCVQKPLLLEEYGGAMHHGRRSLYAHVLETAAAAAVATLPLGGTLFWLLAPASEPDWDGYRRVSCEG